MSMTFAELERIAMENSPNDEEETMTVMPSVLPDCWPSRTVDGEPTVNRGESTSTAAMPVDEPRSTVQQRR